MFISYVAWKDRDYMQVPEIQDRYVSHNPWWNDDQGANSYFNTDFERSDFSHQRDSLAENQITILAGPIGVGRTETTHQLIKLLLDNNTNGANIFYLPLDDPSLKIGSSRAIIQAVTWFNRSVRQPTLDTSEAYLFVDEAHLVDNWLGQISDIASENPDLSIVAVSPTKKQIDQEVLETSELEYNIQILLNEKFHDQASKQLDSYVFENYYSRRKQCRHAISEIAVSDSQESTSQIISLYEDLKPLGRELIGLARKYATTGFLPSQSNEQSSRELETAIYRDIPQFVSVEDISDIHALCAIAAQNSGDSLKLNTVSEYLDCDRRTLQRYLDLLRDFFIITPSYQFDHERRTSTRLYLRDPAVLIALGNISTRGPVLSPYAKRSIYAANAFDHCKRLSFFLNDNQDREVYYYDQNNREVEYVIMAGEHPVPISLAIRKSQNQAKENLTRFTNEYDCEGGIILSTEDKMSVEDRFVTIPLWLFLFIC